MYWIDGLQNKYLNDVQKYPYISYFFASQTLLKRASGGMNLSTAWHPVEVRPLDGRQGLGFLFSRLRLT
jgi:hypothetical protein